MSAPLSEEMPKEWAATLRPFLQRAVEFEKVQPVVAYFLRTHVAFLAAQLHRKTRDPAAVSYLSSFITALETQREGLQAELKGVDGRTALTKAALALFGRADDAERAGRATLDVVRLFFTSSLLFEATGQFATDGALDPIAQERRDYARFIAVRMKRAIESGEAYTSPNAGETSATGRHRDADDSSPQRQGTFSSLPSGRQEQMATNENDGPTAMCTPPPSPPPPPPPAYQQAVFSPTAPAVVTHNNNRSDAKSSGAAGPSMDAMINAQKFAKQAVSALQFYDYVTARKELLSAYELLK